MEPAGEVAGAVGEDRVVWQTLAEPGDDLAQLHRADVLHWRGPREIRRVSRLCLAAPGDRVVRRLQAFQRGDERRRAGVDGKRRPIDATEFLGTGVDVDQRLLRLGDVDQRVTGGRHLAHAPTDEEEHVGLLHAAGEIRVRGDTDIAGVVRVVVIEEHLAAERAADRKIKALGEPPHAGDRRLAPARAAKNDEGPLCRPQHLLQLRHLGEAGMGLDRHDRRQGPRVGLVAEHVFRQRQHDRTRPAGHRDLEGAVDEFRNAIGVVDLLDPFRHLAEHAAEVDLLERLAAAHGPRDLADEHDHRRRILTADVEAGRTAGCARPTRHHDDARTAREFPPRLRGHRGAAFLATDGYGDVGIVERVEEREVTLPRHAEDPLDAVRDQRVGDQPRRGTAVRHRGRTLPRRSDPCRRRRGSRRIRRGRTCGSPAGSRIHRLHRPRCRR